MISAQEIQTSVESIIGQINALHVAIEAMKAEVRGIASTWPPGFGEVEDAVVVEFGISHAELHGRSKRRDISDARFALMLMLTESVRGRPDTICRFLNRDRSMADYGIARAKALAFSDPAYRAKIEKLRSEI